MTRSEIVSVPRSAGSTWSVSVTPTPQQRSEVELSVVVATDGVADNAEHEGGEEANEAAGRGCNPKQEPGHKADGRSSHSVSITMSGAYSSK